MKFYFLFLCFILSAHVLLAQKECGTVTPANRLAVDNAVLQRSTAFTSPYLVKLYFHVFISEIVPHLSVEDTSILRQVENMRQRYAPHGICFLIVGIERIENDDLSIHNASTEEADLTPFVLPGVINIFVHDWLENNDGQLNGTAYNIPNNYLSISQQVIESDINLSTMAHEMGHCFGLYHTFETAFDEEHITRSGACKNCETAGDLLCDTPADPDSDNYETALYITSACVYIGTLTQSCGGATLLYVMNPYNVMAYGRFSCRNMFTNGQGARARAIINNTNILSAAIANDDALTITNQTISSGRKFYVGRNAITINATALIINNSARVNISSNNGITVKPGSTFSPGGGGAFTELRGGGYCY